MTVVLVFAAAALAAFALWRAERAHRFLRDIERRAGLGRHRPSRGPIDDPDAEWLLPWPAAEDLSDAVHGQRVVTGRPPPIQEQLTPPPPAGLGALPPPEGTDQRSWQPGGADGR